VKRLRINLFAFGDCTDVNTWSSLPYYFWRNLSALGSSVQPIDLLPRETPGYVAVRRVSSYYSKIRRGLDHPADLVRSAAFRAFANRQLESMARKHADADLNLFFTFSFSSRRTSGVPVVHYCDRTYEHHLEELGQRPNWKDRVFMRIDQRNIESADLVLTTNELCCDFIKQRYKPKRAFCLKAGVNTDAEVGDPELLLAEKEKSTDILFVGRGAHKRGLDILIRGFKIFNERQLRRYTLHIVSPLSDELDEELRAPDPKIRFHGYLDRTVGSDLKRYNDLMRSARLFVMPMRPGPFPGVVREAQLFCTPVLISNVPGVSEHLTHDSDAVLIDSLEPSELAIEMERLVQDKLRWRRLAHAAHLSRRNRTWGKTIEDFLKIVNEHNVVRTNRGNV
jgi:glycosyltransferase involved in cell wall biosynthesis